MLAITVLSLTAIFKPALCQEPAIDNDLIIYSMSVSTDQKVKFRMPLDIRPGDRITGTVVEEKKSTKGEVNNASSTLQGVVIEIDGKQTKISNRLISFLVPAGITSLPFLLKNAAGEVIERGQIPINSSTTHPMGADLTYTTVIPDKMNSVKETQINGTKFIMEPVGQPGKALRVSGSFDGNAANTNVSLNGQACEIIAKSPRQINFLVPENAATGSANLKVEENNIKEEHTINIAKLNLSANKTTLRKGEKAIITVTVSGLQGLKEGYECKVDITNLSPATVRFKSNTGNSMSQPIPSGQTGDYKFSFNIVGVTQGNYALEGILFCIPDISSLLDRIRNGIQGTGSPYFYRSSSDLELLLKELNKRKNYDYSQNGGKPGPDAEWLWGEIKKIMDILSVRGYKFNEDGTMTRPDGSKVPVR